MTTNPAGFQRLLNELLRRVRVGEDVADLLAPEVRAGEVRDALSPVARQVDGADWVGVNGARVDAIATTSEDEWRIVFGSADGHRIDWLRVFERPPHFAGITGGNAVVINGPSGSGKSTVLQSLRENTPLVPWVVFDEPEQVGSVLDEYLIWKSQTPSLQTGYLAAITAMAAAGNYVALSAGGRPQADFELHLGQIPTVWVGLYCDPSVLAARERSREDRWAGLAAASLAAHDGWHYNLTFDTTASPDPAILAADIAAAVHAKHL